MEKYRHLGKSLEKQAKNHRIIFPLCLDSRALCKIEARGLEGQEDMGMGGKASGDMKIEHGKAPEL